MRTVRAGCRCDDRDTGAGIAGWRLAAEEPGGSHNDTQIDDAVSTGDQTSSPPGPGRLPLPKVAQCRFGVRGQVWGLSCVPDYPFLLRSC
jgi:hypothetical protein